MLSHTETFVAGVTRIPTVFVNAFAVEAGDGGWVMIDTGLPGSANYLQSATESLMGGPPSAIILTHGHFDHAGNAQALAEAWGVPIYAHRAELPFLTGRSDYPPIDPSMGGAIAQMARTFPSRGYDFSGLIEALPADGSVPGLPGWRWILTDGHCPGHVAFWRETDRTILTGDALSTMDLDSWSSQLTHVRELSRAPVHFTTDWDAAEESVRRMARLRPRAIGAGHGRAMTGEDLADRLEEYAAMPQRPGYGRYVKTPARFDEERGVVSVPPPVFDWGLVWLLGGVAVGLLALGTLPKKSRVA